MEYLMYGLQLVVAAVLAVAAASIAAVVCDLADTYLQNLDCQADEWVTLTSLVDHDSSVNQAARDKIVIMLYNLMREASVSMYNATFPASSICRRSTAW